MADYQIRITVIGDDQASGPLGRVHGALGNIAQIAAGGLLAQGVGALAGGIMNAGRAALDSVSGYERMAASMESLLAKEIKNASGIEKTITVGQQRLQLTEKEIAQLDTLRGSLTDATLARDTLNAKIQEQKERIRQLTAQYGENGLVVIKERAELAQLENQLAKTDTAISKYGSQIGALEAKNGKLVDVTQKVVEGQLSMQDALAQAGPKVAELLKWQEKLAILSPFTSQDIGQSLKVGMAYGFTSEQSKRLTQDLVDVAAAMGMEGHELKDLSLIMGQINKGDKLLMQDMRQLTMRGIDVEGVLKKMGFSLSDVGEKAIDSKKFVELMMQSWEEDFGGTAERMANSLPGLLSSLDEIKDLALRDVFTGLFDAAKPALSGLVGLATDPSFRAGLQGFGKMLGEGFKQGIAFIQGTVLPVLGMVLGWFQTQGIPALQRFVSFAGPLLMAALAGLAPFLMGQVLPALLQFGGWIQTVALPALMAFAGFVQANILPVIMQFAQWLGPVIGNAVQQLATWVMGSLLPALGGMINVLATAALPVLMQFGGWLNTILLPAIQQLAGWLGPILNAAFAALGNTIITQIIPNFTAWVKFLLEKGAPALGELLNKVGAIVNGALPTFVQLWQSATKHFESAVKFVGDGIKRLQDLGGVINNEIGPKAQWFNDTILSPLLKTLQGLIGAAESFFDWLGKIAEMLANMQLPDWLQRHSPSPLEQALMNSNEHLREMRGLLPASLGALGNISPRLSRALGAYGITTMRAALNFADTLRAPNPGFGQNLAFASPTLERGAGAGGATYDQRRMWQISGPVNVTANNAQEFLRSLQEQVDVEERFLG